MTILTGEDADHLVEFPHTIYNKIKNHWRGAVAPANIQPGMIWSDSDDDKLYHHGVADDEILQLTKSADVSPAFTTIKLIALTDGYVPCHVSDAAGLADSPIFIDGTKVGIGTDAPGALLHVYGAQSAIKFQRGAADTIWELSSDVTRSYLREMTYGYVMSWGNDGGIKMLGLKSGINQAGAGAELNELWVDTGDQTIKLGT